jgi:hypothetical protein
LLPDLPAGYLVSMVGSLIGSMIRDVPVRVGQPDILQGLRSFESHAPAQLVGGLNPAFEAGQTFSFNLAELRRALLVAQVSLQPKSSQADAGLGAAGWPLAKVEDSHPYANEGHNSDRGHANRREEEKEQLRVHGGPPKKMPQFATLRLPMET